jgi:hypothetical protein
MDKANSPLEEVKSAGFGKVSAILRSGHPAGHFVRGRDEV